MKKETVQQIFKRKVNDNLIDVIFVKPTENTNTPEEQMLKLISLLIPALLPLNQ